MNFFIHQKSPPPHQILSFIYVNYIMAKPINQVTSVCQGCMQYAWWLFTLEFYCVNKSSWQHQENPRKSLLVLFQTVWNIKAKPIGYNICNTIVHTFCAVLRVPNQPNQRAPDRQLYNNTTLHNQMFQYCYS